MHRILVPENKDRCRQKDNAVTKTAHTTLSMKCFFFPCQSQSQVECKCVEGKKSLNPNKSEVLKHCVGGRASGVSLS